jgi:hypothetical protein
LAVDGKAVEMTRQESFKRNIRARMEKTGEKYGAARRAIIERRASGRIWISSPEQGEDTILEATGRTWDQWCDLIDAWPGNDEGHTAIAAYVRDDIGVDGWWAQAVTLGYERITGRRLPHQQPDGTFTANKSKTVRADAEMIRGLLLSEGDRIDMFPGVDTELRSKPDSRVVRLRVGPGTAQISIEPHGQDRAVVAIAHERLPSPEDVEQWKAYWGEWLDALDEAGSP